MTQPARKDDLSEESPPRKAAPPGLAVAPAPKNAPDAVPSPQKKQAGADTVQAADAGEPSAAAGARPGWWRQVQNSTRRGARTTLRFGKELMREHEFWVHTLAVKGGLSAIAVAGVLGISYVVALPFMLAATGVAACGALIGLGAYGMIAGTARGWYRLRKVYAQATGKPLPKKPARTGPTWWQRQAARPFVQKILKSKPVAGFLNSRAWRLTKKYTDGQQDNVLGGLAVGGAVLSLALGVTALATQAVVLPFVAVGGLLTFATVMAASYIISGISGLYFGISGMYHMKKKKREKAAAAARAAMQAFDPEAPAGIAPAAPPAAPEKAGGLSAEKLGDAFQAANDDRPPANDAAPAEPPAQPPAAKASGTKAPPAPGAAPKPPTA